MSDYDEGYKTGLFLAKHPEMARYILGAHQQEIEDSRTADAGATLGLALGSDPTGELRSEPAQPSVQTPQTGNYGQFHNEILAAAQATGLSPQEIFAIQQKETGNRQDAATAQSPTGPVGAMQLSSAAATDVGLDPSERTDPAKNILAGAQYYRRLKDEFGPNAHAAYYDGPGKARSGEFSPEAQAYQASFANEPSQLTGPISLRLPGYYRGSQFRQNGVTGGTGVLGQDMDPVRREYYHSIKKMVNSGNPTLIALGMDMYKQMQEAHIKDLERTAMEKEMNLAGMDPESEAYRQLLVQRMVKPSSQTNINMGPGKPPEGYFWDSDGQSLRAIPGGPRDQTQQPMTESQGNAYLFGSRAADAQNILNEMDDNSDVDLTKLTLKHLGETVPGVGEILGAAANPQLSGDEQRTDQARRNFVNALLRRESGATISPSEFANANAQYFPMHGDLPETIAQKRRNREMAIKGILETAGARGKEIRIPEYKPKQSKVPPLPKLPEGHRWVE